MSSRALLSSCAPIYASRQALQTRFGPVRWPWQFHGRNDGFIKRFAFLVSQQYWHSSRGLLLVSRSLARAASRVACCVGDRVLRRWMAACRSSKTSAVTRMFSHDEGRMSATTDEVRKHDALQPCWQDAVMSSSGRLTSSSAIGCMLHANYDWR